MMMRYTRFRTQTRQDDQLYQGRARDPLTTRNAKMLKALGYIEDADEISSEGDSQTESPE